MSLFAALKGEPQLRRPVEYNGSRIDYEPDAAVARTCGGCGRAFLSAAAGTLYETTTCRMCADRATDPMTRRTTTDDVRRGAWQPGPELAATLRAHGQEISACPVCGRVRLRLVGQACGGTGCEKQRGLF